jgi:hypothetical protein
VKVFLLQIEEGGRLFYAAASEPRHAPPAHRGLRGWAERKAHALRNTWNHAETGLVGWLHRVWHKLHNQFVPADEAMLIHLRTTPVVEVHHPTTITSEEARALWTGYLADRRRRRLPWLALDALISPLTVLLAPLPGPNLIGYWFAYRAVRHLLALLGIRHAGSAEVETTFYPDPALDRIFTFESDMVVPSPNFVDDPKHLGKFLRQSRPRWTRRTPQEAAAQA